MPNVAASSVSPEYHLRAKSGVRGFAGMEANGVFPHLKNLLNLPGVVSLALETDSTLPKDDYPEALFAIVYDGIFGVQQFLGDGRRSISHLFFPGDIIDFRYSEKVQGCVVCLFASKLVLVDGDSFSALKDEGQETLKVLGGSLMKHWELATQHCTDLARKSAVEKLASYIFECQNRTPPATGEDGKGVIHLALRRVDISDYLGLRPETLCRAFAKLKQSKLIEFTDVDHVQIRDEGVLRNIANGCSMNKKPAALKDAG